SACRRRRAWLSFRAAALPDESIVLNRSRSSSVMVTLYICAFPGHGGPPSVAPGFWDGTVRMNGHVIPVNQELTEDQEPVRGRSPSGDGGDRGRRLGKRDARSSPVRPVRGPLIVGRHAPNPRIFEDGPRCRVALGVAAPTRPGKSTGTVAKGHRGH